MRSKISMKFILTLLILLISFHSISAQGDQIQQGGKLYAVVACVVIILIGIGAFLFYLERRISKIEQHDELH